MKEAQEALENKEITIVAADDSEKITEQEDVDKDEEKMEAESAHADVDEECPEVEEAGLLDEAELEKEKNSDNEEKEEEAPKKRRLFNAKEQRRRQNGLQGLEASALFLAYHLFVLNLK